MIRVDVVVSYDQQAAAAYVSLHRLADPTAMVARSETCDPGLDGINVVDLDADGRLFGVELLGGQEYAHPVLQAAYATIAGYGTATVPLYVSVVGETAYLTFEDGPAAGRRCACGNVVSLLFDEAERFVGVEAPVALLRADLLGAPS